MLLGRKDNDPSTATAATSGTYGGGIHLISGGRDSCRLSGGKGKIFSAQLVQVLHSSLLNAIADFDCNRDDRIGFRATLDGNSLFANRGWIFINARPFTAAGRAEPRFTMAGRLLGG